MEFVRVLFSSTAGSGHFGPLIPFARACVFAGHSVAVAAPVSFAAQVVGAGLEHLPFPDVPADVLGAVFSRVSRAPREEGDQMVLSDVFARLDAQAALPALTVMMTEWAPDIVVRETCEFAALVAAERAGVPQVHVAIGMNVGMGGLAQMLEQPLAELSELAGLPGARGGQLLTRTATFTSVPELLDRPDDEPASPSSSASGQGARIWRFRDAHDAGSGRLPTDWGDRDAPLVYVSFGSVTATVGHFGGIYQTTLTALADLPVRVLMTTGQGLDPASLEPIPANACVERWWPQADVMALAAVMVGHGGFGTTMMALGAGVPQVVVPLFAFDQFVHASRVAAVGAGVRLLGGLSTSDQLRAAVEQLLRDPSYAMGARAVADEIAALPDVNNSPEVLEKLAGLQT